MRYVIASVLFLLLLFSFMQNWTVAFVLTLLLFSVRFSTIVLLPTAFFLDGYYGNYQVFPYLTGLALVWYLFTEFVRPKVTTMYANE